MKAALQARGVCVVKNAVPREVCKLWCKRAEAGEVHAHDDLMWEIRSHPNVLGMFANVWDVDQDTLITGFDGIGVQQATETPFVLPWHVDQDNRHPDGMVCVQAVLALSDSDTTEFAVGSHVLHSQLVAGSKRQVWQFVDVDAKSIKAFEIERPSLEPGDVVIWDSRTVHRVNTGTKSRVVAYLSMVPVHAASVPTLRQRRQLYDQGVATTHWAQHPVARGVPRQPTMLYRDASPRRKQLVDGWVTH